MSLIEELRSLIAKATPGPWEAPTQPESVVNVWAPTRNVCHEISGPDAEAIVALFNAAPALLDVAEAAAKVSCYQNAASHELVAALERLEAYASSLLLCAVVVVEIRPCRQ